MASRFQRFLLPGFAFKAVVIGGGYATGRALAGIFLLVYVLPLLTVGLARLRRGATAETRAQQRHLL